MTIRYDTIGEFNVDLSYQRYDMTHRLATKHNITDDDDRRLWPVWRRATATDATL